MSIKLDAMRALSTRSELSIDEDLNEDLALQADLQEAEEDIRMGKVVSHEEVKRRLSTWISN